MPIWQAINHAMSAIATGGFAITDNSFGSYSFIIKLIGIFLVILGSMSFSVHYKIFVQRKFLEIFKNIQNRVFYILLVGGAILIILINFDKSHYVNYVFEWESSLGTCGFSAGNICFINSCN
ncbi:MAG: Trk system potassium uptake protein TrkH [Candidatus Anoxychlamydiales bacterium]|nr:Trk system potassium uptake protein TrkH [Candidatus Anoxychlamydiales bacterium]